MRSTVALGAIALAGLMAARPAAAQEKASGADREAFVVDKKLADQGRKLFSAKTCTACHTVGKGVLVGPDLAGVLDRRSPTWLRAWLHDPPAVLATDAYAKALKEKYHIEMPNLGLTDNEITALIHYLAAQSAGAKPR